MQVAELAKAAVEQAFDAYKTAIRIEGMLDLVQKAVEAFERRTSDRLESAERRTEARLEAQEARIRELEREVASLRGKVDGAMAEAITTALLQPEIQRKLAADAARPKAPPAPRLPGKGPFNNDGSPSGT